MRLYDEIENSFLLMERLFSEKDLLDFKNAYVSELYKYHFSIGLWIRNNLIYPEQSPLRLLFIDNGVENPDDMSSMIIQLFHYYISRSK